jgi:hypothetical protein
VGGRRAIGVKSAALFCVFLMLALYPWGLPTRQQLRNECQARLATRHQLQCGCVRHARNESQTRIATRHQLQCGCVRHAKTRVKRGLPRGYPRDNNCNVAVSATQERESSAARHATTTAMWRCPPRKKETQARFAMRQQLQCGGVRNAETIVTRGLPRDNNCNVALPATQTRESSAAVDGNRLASKARKTPTLDLQHNL